MAKPIHLKDHNIDARIVQRRLVLAAVFLMRAYGWQSGGLLYVGLALMVGVSVWDFISPAHRRCGPDSCELPEQRG